jgi:hypothetical protein
MGLVRLTCDKGCKQEFILTKPGAAIVREDILKTYSNCPHCGQEYISYYTNGPIRELQEMLRILQSGTQSNKRKTKRLIKDLKDRIQVGMERLKEDIEG